jgi:hypothetical protein
MEQLLLFIPQMLRTPLREVQTVSVVVLTVLHPHVMFGEKTNKCFLFELAVTVHKFAHSQLDLVSERVRTPSPLT